MNPDTDNSVTVRIEHFHPSTLLRQVYGLKMVGGKLRRDGPFFGFHKPKPNAVDSSTRKLHVSGSYNSGKRSGIWSYFSYDGTLIGRFTYDDNGCKHGAFEWRHIKSRIEVTGKFCHGKRVGTWTWWPDFEARYSYFVETGVPYATTASTHFLPQQLPPAAIPRRSSSKGSVFYRRQTYDEHGRLHGLQLINRVLRFRGENFCSNNPNPPKVKALLPHARIQWLDNRWNGTSTLHRRNGSLLCRVEAKCGRIEALQFYRKGCFAQVYANLEPDRSTRRDRKRTHSLYGRSRSRSRSPARSRSRSRSPARSRSRSPARPNNRPRDVAVARRMVVILHGSARSKTYQNNFHRRSARKPHLGAIEPTTSKEVIRHAWNALRFVTVEHSLPSSLWLDDKAKSYCEALQYFSRQAVKPNPTYKSLHGLWLLQKRSRPRSNFGAPKSRLY
jgi:hypothetical protein